MTNVAVETIEKIVAEHFGIHIADFFLKERPKPRVIAEATQFLMYFLHTVLGVSQLIVAQRYGTTKRYVFMACAKIKGGLQNQPFYMNHVSQLQNEMIRQGIL